MDPLVSIIIPCYNASGFLELTVNTVLKQNYQHLEIIIVNDGSNEPQTLKLLENFSDKRITIIHQENKGVSSARNIGLRSATGKYIMFLDADDLFSPDYIQKLVHFFEQNDAYGVSGGEVIKIDATGKSTGEQIKSGEGEIQKKILLYDPVVSTCPSVYLIRRNILIKNNISFNETLTSTADKFFFIQLSRFTKFHHQPGIFLYYRVHQGGMSFTLNDRLLNDNIKYYEELKKYNLIPDEIKSHVLLKKNYMLAASYYKMKRYGSGMKFAIKGFFQNPVRFIQLMRNKH